jgi:uncharacterized Ntn-hydrolase superfamily protein
MENGLLPKEILHEVNVSDYDGDSTIRQYGIALFDSSGHPRTWAYTGDSCFDYKNHIIGPYYTIQGNILLGRFILDSMEARFLRATGSLADRLMAALQGANVSGADSRCEPEGVPSKSSFIRVAKPGDHKDSLYLHLVVKSRPYGISPIDSLQTLFNEWKLAHPSSVNDLKDDEVKIYPNPSKTVCNIQFATNKRRVVEVFDAMGKLVHTNTCFVYCQLPTANWQKGIYFIKVERKTHKLIVE